MLPTLDDFGVPTPVYIRKLDSRTHWNPEGCINQQERVQRIAERIFKHSVNSLWLINSNQDFYGMVASLSAKRNPRQQDIDFIWITEEELNEVGINFKQVVEGDCLHAQSLHYNADIDQEQAKKLCEILTSKGRETKRCKRKQTEEIIKYLENSGCKALVANYLRCKCVAQKD
ncbi:MAG TPA: hypothetical protein VK203_01730 [Nostocaceae cyanobacterium]|nr:hypothetical protein [Nostocaceae cyanobacterium]